MLPVLGTIPAVTVFETTVTAMPVQSLVAVSVYVTVPPAVGDCWDRAAESLIDLPTTMLDDDNVVVSAGLAVTLAITKTVWV